MSKLQQYDSVNCLWWYDDDYEDDMEDKEL